MVWLISKVNPDNICAEYTFLLDKLQHTEFYWTNDRDKNRAHDGVSLRHDYIYETGHGLIPSSESCTILELLIALAIRCDKDILGDPNDVYLASWFWDMIKNLGLFEMNDWNYDGVFVDYILQRWMNREYSYDGKGGLFPLKRPMQDQRGLEIWLQMHSYLNENYYDI